MFDKFRDILFNKQEIEKVIEENENLIKHNIIEKRASQNRVYLVCMLLCIHRYFQALITTCILINTVVLALDEYPINELKTKILDLLNMGFYIIFVFEMIIKLLGLGIKEYFNDKFNAFDFVIVVISSIDVALT